MRSDMHKVIVERPRRGHSERSKKTARRWSPNDLASVALGTNGQPILVRVRVFR